MGGRKTISEEEAEMTSFAKNESNAIEKMIDVDFAEDDSDEVHDFDDFSKLSEYENKIDRALSKSERNRILIEKEHFQRENEIVKNKRFYKLMIITTLVAFVAVVTGSIMIVTALTGI